MIVLSGLPGRLPDNNSGTLFVKTETAHICDTCHRRLKLGPAYFAWDVLGAYFVHRECKVRTLVNRRPTVVAPLPELPTIVPVVDKRKRGAPKNKWEAERVGWDGKTIN